MIGASLTLGETDFDVLFLPQRVEIEGRIVATAALIKRTQLFSSHLIKVGAGAVEVHCVIYLSASSIFTAN